MSAWPKKVRVSLPGRTMAYDIIDGLELDSNLHESMAAKIDAITVTFTVDQDGHILVVSLWRGKEEAGT
jgi:hypothetical protein